MGGALFSHDTGWELYKQICAGQNPLKSSELSQHDCVRARKHKQRATYLAWSPSRKNSSGCTACERLSLLLQLSLKVSYFLELQGIESSLVSQTTPEGVACTTKSLWYLEHLSGNGVIMIAGHLLCMFPATLLSLLHTRAHAYTHTCTHTHIHTHTQSLTLMQNTQSADWDNTSYCLEEISWELLLLWPSYN